MMKDPTEFRQRFADWKAGKKVHYAGKPITDNEYYDIMERVAKENWEKWGDSSEDAALTRILNANDYDYRGYYNKYPNSRANSDTHWTDEFKTVYHPTFSDESIYSGKKSKFNPEGLKGGHWHGEVFKPQSWQKKIDIPKYDMGDPPTKNNVSNSEKLLNELSGTEFDPIIYKGWSSNDDRARAFLIDSNIRLHEDAQDVRDFFDSYTHSDGYQRIMDNQYSWFQQRHPYRRWLVPQADISSEPGWWNLGRASLGDIVRDDNKNQNKYSKIFALDGYPEVSFHTGAGTFVFKGNDYQYNSKKWPNNFVLAHEYAHRFPQFYPGNSEALSQNKNTKEGHDSQVDEKHSDIWGLKYLLYKEGIYDSRGKKDVAPVQIEKLRKKYPTLRPLLQMDNKKVAWMLNHVTKNTTIKPPHAG